MLKVLILFGSESDKYVYDSLIEKLSEFSQVDFAVLSAHRDPAALEIKLQESSADMILAGAGLAAHLPGVIAAKVMVPVCGIPVNSVFAGLDALASIQQMPFGVPVLTSAPDNTERLAKFVSEVAKGKVKNKQINLVFPQDKKSDKYFQKELQRSKEFAQERGFLIKESAFLDDATININLVNDESEVIEGSTVLHIPVLSDEQKNRPEFLCQLLKWVNKGGLWFGVNNCRNALIFIEKLNKMTITKE